MELFAVQDDTGRPMPVPPAELAPVEPDLTERLARTLARRAPALARAGARVLRR